MANPHAGVFHFASPGDAVIVTSTGLVETDPGLRHLPLETRVAELARRLDQARLKRRVRDKIARTRSRLFALGSVTLNGPPDSLLSDFQTMLDRQSEFVSNGFGPLAIDDNTSPPRLTRG
jgi:hypothetical protein